MRGFRFQKTENGFFLTHTDNALAAIRETAAARKYGVYDRSGSVAVIGIVCIF